MHVCLHVHVCVCLCTPVHVQDPGSSATAKDCVVEDNEGCGVQVSGGGRAVLDGGRLGGSRTMSGLEVADGSSSVEAKDVTIEVMQALTCLPLPSSSHLAHTFSHLAHTFSHIANTFSHPLTPYTYLSHTFPHLLTPCSLLLTPCSHLPAPA